MPAGMSNAEYLHGLRVKAVAEGKCFSCRCRPVREGARYCDPCIKRTADYKKKIAYIKCARCGAEDPGALICRECTAKTSEYNRRRMADAVSQGMCSKCIVRPLRPGHPVCTQCLDDTRDRVVASKRRRGAKLGRPCSICSQLGLNGFGHNRTTHDRWMERSKAWTTPRPASDETPAVASSPCSPPPAARRRRAA